MVLSERIEKNKGRMIRVKFVTPSINTDHVMNHIDLNDVVYINNEGKVFLVAHRSDVRHFGHVEQKLYMHGKRCEIQEITKYTIGLDDLKILDKYEGAVEPVDPSRIELQKEYGYLIKKVNSRLYKYSERDTFKFKNHGGADVGDIYYKNDIGENYLVLRERNVKEFDQINQRVVAKWPDRWCCDVADICECYILDLEYFSRFDQKTILKKAKHIPRTGLTIAQRAGMTKGGNGSYANGDLIYVTGNLEYYLIAKSELVEHFLPLEGKAVVSQDKLESGAMAVLGLITNEDLDWLEDERPETKIRISVDSGRMGGKLKKMAEEVEQAFAHNQRVKHLNRYINEK